MKIRRNKKFPRVESLRIQCKEKKVKSFSSHPNLSGSELKSWVSHGKITDISQ